MRDVFLYSERNPTLDEKIFHARAVIDAHRATRRMLAGQLNLYPRPDLAPVILSQDIKNLGQLLVAEGRRLGGLVAAQRRQQ